MKRVFMLMLLSIVLFGFVACNNKKDNTSAKMTIAMVSSIGSIDDRSFNQNTWEGILKFVYENNISPSDYAYISSHKPEDYAINLSNFADEGKSLIISPSFYFKEPINKVALKYPQQKFLLIDAVSKIKTNVLSVTFATEQSSYLAGICVALKAKQLGLKTVGFLGGIDNSIVQSFEAGYIAGIEAIDANIKVVVEYANDFANPTKGQKIASAMFNKDIKIIFGVAGNTGNGLIAEAKKRARMGEEVWVVGVDKDQYNDGIYEDGKSVILTSSLKKLDNATYDALKSIKNGKFKSGHIVYSLKNDGVGLPKSNPNLKDEWIKMVEKYKKDIISGKIKVPVKPNRVLG